ncbi:hypothetical protein D3C78_1369260 [compost metagenome]
MAVRLDIGRQLDSEEGLALYKCSWGVLPYCRHLRLYFDNAVFIHYFIYLLYIYGRLIVWFVPYLVDRGCLLFCRVGAARSSCRKQ